MIAKDHLMVVANSKEEFTSEDIIEYVDINPISFSSLMTALTNLQKTKQIVRSRGKTSSNGRKVYKKGPVAYKLADVKPKKLPDLELLNNFKTKKW